MKIVAGSIDLSKIDKSRIVAGKNGAKYYNISIIINDEKDKYGNDVAITTGQTKEERAYGEKQHYIGNGKTVYTKEPQASNSAPTDNDDLPF